MRALLVAALAVAAGTASLSCNVNQYCLNCDKGDGGGPKDAPTDGGGGSATDAGDGGNCVPTGDEICDGKDNDCDGNIDEGVLPGTGVACTNQKGECAGGKIACIAGKLDCTKKGSPEICDLKDNDCDGVVDNGDPGDGVTQGGSKCGTDLGECVAGTNHCVNGAVVCQGRVDSTGGEQCNAKDDDCDGQFDEGLDNMGPCGSSSVGECGLGHFVCKPGGIVKCEGEKAPSFELCNHKDDDCDGHTDEDFDLTSDPQNCGDCGVVCQFDHAFASCTTVSPGAPTCGIAACQSGFHDNNHDKSDGCEFGPCTISGAEVCDGSDNDCSSVADDHLGPPPAICATKGACANTTATCDGSDGFRCHYPGGPSGVTVDGDFNIQPETRCDGIDNDCDGKTDEGQIGLGAPCTDSGLGVCQGKGHLGCNPANLDGPAICIIDQPGIGSSAETCDNLDNDCDGKIDEGAGSGNIGGQLWVDIGNHKQMMQFEASRPDSGSNTVGSVSSTVCSKPNAQPWINIKYPDAVAACATVGAQLCTEQDWHRTCSDVAPTTYPVGLGSGSNLSQTIEAEDYFANAPAPTASNGRIHAWVENYASVDTNGRVFSGISDMQATPDVSTSIDLTAVDVRTIAPRLDYKFTMTKASSVYTVWVLLYAQSGSSVNGGSNRVAVGFDGAQPTDNNNQRIPIPDLQVWEWAKSGTFTLAAGTHTLNVYMARDGVRMDAIAITDGTASNAAPALPANGRGGTWSYATNPTTPQTGVCNDRNFHASDDATVATATTTTCHPTSKSINDLSGNVKEWVLAHTTNEDPIRGGAANSDDTGTTCALNFTLADDAFFFPNVGFRCCRAGP